MYCALRGFWHMLMAGGYRPSVEGVQPAGGTLVAFTRPRVSAPDPYREFFRANPQPMWAYDVETLRFLDVNDAALATYGYTRDQFLARDLTDILAHADADFIRTAVRAHRGVSHRTAAPVRHRLRNGQEIEVEVTSQPMVFEGRPATLVAVRDIGAQRSLEERLRQQAFHDPSTGLGNRHHLMQTLEAVLQQQSTTGARCALLLIDVDLSIVNTELGRDIGDQFLLAIIERLKAVCDERITMSRVGEATLGLLVGDVGDVGAREHAEQILATLKRPFFISGYEVVAAAHVGGSVAEIGWRADDVLRTADAALQALHARGGAGRVAIFNADPDVLHHVLSGKSFALETELRRAVADGQLRIHYQPILDLRSHRIAGVEALVRWVHPDRGLIVPKEFIPIAERSGFVSEIDAWVLATACRQIASWRETGLAGLTMSVNISGHDLDQGPELVRLIRTALAANAMDPSLLEIELTESTAFHDQEEVQTLIDDLRVLGVRFALDDFGTGYSMLDRIRDLRVDRIKVDRTFVRRVATDGAALVAAMIAMAHGLHLSVVAEGVESRAQLDALVHHGCDFAQGFLIGRPVPAEDISAQLTVRS